MTPRLARFFETQSARVDAALDQVLPPAKAHPCTIHEAMRYAVFSGGKRFRPVLAIMSFQACGGKGDRILNAACAIELIHAFSLVHDDLPALDNDEYRRGRLSCHAQYGEAVGILAGDAMLPLAFGLLCGCGTRGTEQGQAAVQVLSKAIGSYGMIGGQIADLEHVALMESPGNRYRVKPPASSSKPLTVKAQEVLKRLNEINAQKTAALIAASAGIGALLAGSGKALTQRLSQYGHSLGMGFQVTDDLLDSDGVVSIVGEAKAREMAERYIGEAKQQIKPLGKKAVLLDELANFVRDRTA
ncbi:MAG: polyprenyl synthetase family protein [Candidatus Omnitrophica bacterium]|nr:polyprenyl synthetase family protein [Candidatus Omnitrophota bacterium]